MTKPKLLRKTLSWTIDPAILAGLRMMSGKALSRMAKPKQVKKVTSRTTKPATGSWKMPILQPIPPKDLLRREGSIKVIITAWGFQREEIGLSGRSE